MNENTNILTDNFGRKHSYLRISLTEKCNLRCTYCMPAEGIPLSPKSHLMSADEIFEIASVFVKNGVTKIRLTGGEPFVRKDFDVIIKKLAQLPVEIAITTNGILLHKYLPLLKKLNILNITISLDSLKAKKFNTITRRNYFEKVWKNIELLKQEVEQVKLNIVLIKGFNDNEIFDFIELTKHENFKVRFIEFMPFDGNEWKTDKLVTEQNIIDHASENGILQRLKDAPNDTAKNFKIKGYRGSFAIISSITNPFCDSCNRIRLTADGKLKNCLFSNNETNILTSYRNGENIEPLIESAINKKHKTRGGMNTWEKIKSPELHSKNRSMIAIGG